MTVRRRYEFYLPVLMVSPTSEFERESTSRDRLFALSPRLNQTEMSTSSTRLKNLTAQLFHSLLLDTS